MDIGRIVKRVLRKWYIVVGVVVLVIACGLGGAKLLVKDTYLSKGSCYVASVYEGENSVDMTSGILNNFMNLAKTKAVLKAVAVDTAVKNIGYTVDMLDKQLSVERNNNLINITCVTESAEHSKAIVNAYINSGMPKVRAFLGARVELFDYTIVATPEIGEKQSRNTIMVLVVSLMVGLIIGVGIVIAPMLLGKVPLTAEEIPQDFETRLLSVVPKAVNSAKAKGEESENVQPISSYNTSISMLSSTISAQGESKYCLAPIAKGDNAIAIARDLAIQCGEYNKVLLVDADLRKQGGQESFEVGDVGLSEYLLGRATIEDIVYNVSDNLAVIPTGKHCDKALPRLLRSGWQHAWSEIERLADNIIVSAPAFECGHDALTISSVVKNIALVIDSKTAKKTVNNIINDIDGANINLLGIVMNK